MFMLMSCLERVFQVGDWIDCEDTSKKWLVARIMQINNENGTVYVHFDGSTHLHRTLRNCHVDGC